MRSRRQPGSVSPVTVRRVRGDPDKGFPSIQGQPAGCLQAQLMMLKEDKRKLEDAAQDELKKKLLKGMSDRDIADVAAYYSTLK